MVSCGVVQYVIQADTCFGPGLILLLRSIPDSSSIEHVTSTLPDKNGEESGQRERKESD